MILLREDYLLMIYSSSWVSLIPCWQIKLAEIIINVYTRQICYDDAHLYVISSFFECTFRLKRNFGHQFCFSSHIWFIINEDHLKTYFASYIIGRESIVDKPTSIISIGNFSMCRYISPHKLLEIMVNFAQFMRNIFSSHKEIVVELDFQWRRRDKQLRSRDQSTDRTTIANKTELRLYGKHTSIFPSIFCEHDCITRVRPVSLVVKRIVLRCFMETYDAAMISQNKN